MPGARHIDDIKNVGRFNGMNPSLVSCAPKGNCKYVSLRDVSASVARK